MEWSAHLPLEGGGGVSTWYQSKKHTITLDMRIDDTTQRGIRA